MSLKKTDLEKMKGLKINGAMREAGTPARLGNAAAEALSRREQRKLDQARGLIPFAVKLEADLVERVRSLAGERACDINEVVADLLRKGLDAKA